MNWVLTGDVHHWIAGICRGIRAYLYYQYKVYSIFPVLKYFIQVYTYRYCEFERISSMLCLNTWKIQSPYIYEIITKLLVCISTIQIHCDTLLNHCSCTDYANNPHSLRWVKFNCQQHVFHEQHCKKWWLNWPMLIMSVAWLHYSIIKLSTPIW